MEEKCKEPLSIANYREKFWKQIHEEFVAKITKFLVSEKFIKKSETSEKFKEYKSSIKIDKVIEDFFESDNRKLLKTKEPKPVQFFNISYSKTSILKEKFWIVDKAQYDQICKDLKIQKVLMKDEYVRKLMQMNPKERLDLLSQIIGRCKTPEKLKKKTTTVLQFYHITSRYFDK